MSKDPFSVRIGGRSNSKSSQVESNENEFENVLDSSHFPPHRTPLNTIPDPSQCQGELQEAIRGGHKRIDSYPSELTHIKGIGNVGTPTSRVTGKGKSHSDPNSAQSTPSRSVPRASNVGACTGPRPPLHNVAKGNSSSRVHRAISISTVNSDPLIEVPHFELVEDPLFWKDHNVQVLIRIRPLSYAEKALQGYGQCLRQESEQTLLWLGHPETRFTFDHIACETISQEKLFRVAGLPMVENCMSGYNSCMFAYGQTGSGKTYTMMGEIDQMDCNFNEDCGITPRIFEYLFSRIIEEEENRRHERLKYICKCSFLEIYNEQITDLLEPSSTNLQLREDLKKGVYVENLREYNVRTVDDVVELLLQGAANRKISATHMNSESSRSHSVFTCVIESSWEKDSMTHLRFGRLNLVDLAGSERQKSSGAEGDRLKEAANINKSLSTLGLVIMSLVDLAHGKHRHVPYRDSRLTFLLQDSLGGNSKTTIIANVSPSICSANETLSTLKFAQRAKLIQNNAKVNEDASGDVIALQKQIHQLKGQLSLLMEHHCTPRSLSPTIPIIKQSTLENFLDGCNLVDENDQKIPNGRKKKMKYTDAILIGALRREKAAESEIRKLEAEIEQINHFASQREEDLQRTKMLLRFREEKIKRLELLADGIVSDDNYLMDENNILKEEIQLLQAKIDRNPELTRFALENIKLIEQLRSFQDFCEHGERETLIAEVSELRDQLLETLEGNFQQLKIPSTMENQDEATSFGSDSGVKSTSYNELEHSVSGNQMNPNTSGDSYFQHRETQTELMKAMEQEQVCLIEELELMREENSRLRRILIDEDKVEDNSRENMLKLENPTSVTSVIENTGIIALQTKLAKLSKDLEEAQLVNNQFVKDHESQLSQDRQRELVREEAEMETTNTILHLQDEVTALQSELQERLCSISEDNMRLRKSVAAKEEQIKSLSSEWERAILELTSFLMDGSKSLSEASHQIESIVCLFPQINVWVGEHVERAAKVCVEKEETLALLQKSLEDAQKLVLQMEQKLNSLKGAAMALTESKQPENDISTREAIQLTTLLDDQINKAEKHANAGLLVAKGLSDEPNHVEEDTSRSIANDTGNRSISKMESTNTSVLQDIEIQLELASLGLLEAHNDINASCSDAEMYISALQADIQKTVSLYRELVEDFVNNVCEIRKNLGKLKVIDGNFGICITEIKPNHEIQQEMLHQIRDELAKTNERLNVISACLNTVLTMHHCPIAIDDLVEEGHSNASSTSDSSLPIETVTLKDILNKSSSGCYYQKHEMVTDGTQDKEAPGGSTLSSEIQESEKSERVINNLTQNQTTVSCLRKEFKKAYNSFIELNAHLASLLNDKETQDCSEAERVGFLQSLAITNENVQHMCSDGVNQPKTVAVGCGARELIADKKTSPGSSFFTKLEEAHTTMKEADYMLNALMIANKNAEELSTMWKQAGEELMVEKAKLLEEIEQLKSSIHLKNEENEVLQEQIQYSFKELADSVYSLEGSVVHVQREVEQTSQILCSDSLTLAKDVLHCICNTRSAMEQVLIDALGHNFASFVLHQCHIGDFFRKFRSLSMDAVCNSSNLQEGYLDTNNLLNITRMFNDMKVEELGDQTTVVRRPEVGHLRLEHDDPISENLELKKELQRKDVLLKGLLFDFSLLQESASTKKDIEDESGKLIVALSQLQHELQMKTSLLDKMLVQHKELESRLADTEAALAISNSDLEQVKGTLATFTDQNTELMVLLKDLYLMKSATEEQLEEQKEIIGSLEKEILHLTSESEKQLLSAKREMEDHTRRVISERDQLLEHVQSLQDRLAMAYALVDENEAIAVEARQVSETSKLYAEEKEEEVKILERSVEELECTINVLEKKVYEMEDDVERHRLMRDSLELELQALRRRLLTVENFTENLDPGNSNIEPTVENQLSRSLELHEAQNRTRILEEERTGQAKEIKQLKEYVSELVLHAEAQASQYQQKYNTLEAMVREVKTDSSSHTSEAVTLHKTEKGATRTRGSSSPFRCISTLVHQMNLEKDQELSTAKICIEELEESLASRQKEVCMLNTRLASAENMTHDVIRDLLGVKLDMTNYANIIDQYQLQRLVEATQQRSQESSALEEEILNLRRQIDHLSEERERCVSEVNRRESDILAAQMTIEQLHERDQLLSAQNEMLKKDKSNLKRRVAELDDMLKKLLGSQNNHLQTHQKITNLLRAGDTDLSRRLAHSEKLLSHVNDELAQFRKPESSHRHDQADARGTHSKFRKHKA